MPFSLTEYCQAARDQRTLFNLEQFLHHRSPQLHSTQARSDALRYIDSCIQQELSALNLSNYPAAAITELEDAIRRMNTLPENCDVMLGNGIIALLEELLHAFAKDTSILLPQLDFFLYDITLEKLAIRPVKFASTQDGHWNLDDAVKKQQEHDPAIILLSTPNNPTSRAAPLEFIKTLASTTNGLLIIDEVYHLFANDPHAIKSLLQAHDNLVILRSMSKAGYAATGFGYVIGNKEIITCLRQLKGGRAIPALNVAAGKALIENHALLEKYIQSCCQWRDHVKSSIAQHTALTCLPSETDFLLIKTPEGQADALTKRIQEAGIPCISYAPLSPLNNYIRVIPSNIPDAEKLKLLLELLNAPDETTQPTTKTAEPDLAPR